MVNCLQHVLIYFCGKAKQVTEPGVCTKSLNILYYTKAKTVMQNPSWELLKSLSCQKQHVND